MNKGRKTRFKLNAFEKKAVDTLNQSLILTSELVLIQAMGQFTIDTDAYDSLVRSVLLRKKADETLNLADYWWRTMASAKSWYDTTNQKCLLVI